MNRTLRFIQALTLMTLMIGVAFFSALPNVGAEPVFGSNIRVNDEEHQGRFGAVAVDSNGDAYFYTVHQFAPGTPGKYLTKYETATETMGEDVLVLETPEGGNVWRSEIGIDSNDNIYMLSSIGNYPDDLYHIIKTTDGGETFEDPVVIDDTRLFYPHMIIVDDVIYISYYQGSYPDPYGVYFTKSTDGGATFTTPVLVYDEALIYYYPGDIDVDSNGNIIVVFTARSADNGYEIQMSRSTNGGASFSDSVKVSDYSDSPYEKSPRMSIDDSNNIYVVWEDFRNGNGDIYFTSSTNGGDTFSDNIKVNDALGSIGDHQREPEIIATGNGIVYVAYADMYNIPVDPWWYSNLNVHESLDGGASFCDSIRVNDIDECKPLMPNMDVNGGMLYICWYDQRTPTPGGRGFRQDTYSCGTEVPEGSVAQEVPFDIMPGSEKNQINLKSKGVIPVAVLTDETFDASDIDIGTVTFGPGEAPPDHLHYHLEDVDDDGDLDAVMHFRVQLCGFTKDDTEATIKGETFGGIEFYGTDIVTIK